MPDCRRTGPPRVRRAEKRDDWRPHRCREVHGARVVGNDDFRAGGERGETDRIEVRAQGSRVSLTVEDSGPGIPEAERPRLFDRFHRATEHGSGSGLGLAIGDSIVRSTGGRWQVGDSPLGGALMSVSWRHAQPGRTGASLAARAPQA